MSLDDDEFLGSGWGFPVGARGGELRQASGADSIEQSIRLILETAKGERVMRPDFGCGIHEYVFETIDTSTQTLIATTVEDALIEWEPRIEVLGVSVSTDRIESGELNIGIEYRIRRTNEERNLVYPFYVGSG